MKYRATPCNPDCSQCGWFCSNLWEPIWPFQTFCYLYPFLISTSDFLSEFLCQFGSQYWTHSDPGTFKFFGFGTWGKVPESVLEYLVPKKSWNRSQRKFGTETSLETGIRENLALSCHTLLQCLASTLCLLCLNLWKRDQIKTWGCLSISGGTKYVMVRTHFVSCFSKPVRRTI